MTFERKALAIGIATYDIEIFDVERSQYTAKDTGKVQNINRVSTNLGVIIVNDDVADKLIKAQESFVNALHGKGTPEPALLVANCYTKDGVNRWQISV